MDSWPACHEFEPGTTEDPPSAFHFLSIRERRAQRVPHKPGAPVIPAAHKGPDNQIFIGCQDLRPAEMKTDALLRPAMETGRVEAVRMSKNRNPPHLHPLPCPKIHFV
ncbi:hypothetical protein TNCV_3918771 [Trichonephila clavipes]|nr:hypothetical protein TNCV_3918771 [Trichonephila clavipes]